MAQQLAEMVTRPELPKIRDLPSGLSEDMPGTGRLSRSIWEVSVDDLAATEWDLTPRRREKGELEELLSSLREALGDSGTVAPLADVGEINAGRAIKSTDLTDEPQGDRAVAYIRIKDLAQGKVGRSSNWLSPTAAEGERRWALLPGDVLISKSGTIGKTALVRNGAVGAVASSGLYTVRIDQNRLDPGFLLAYFGSQACQTWLKGRSRGAVIQHLNRAVLDELPIPLPPLPMQNRAAAQFRDFGTDVLLFLAQLTGTDASDRLTPWLSELSNVVPEFIAALDGTPPLSSLERLAALAGTARRWLNQERIGSQPQRWLMPLTDTLLSLAGVTQIPPGPSLLNVLQEAERGLKVVLEQATGHLPNDTQVRAMSVRLQTWLGALISDLVDQCDIQVRAAQNELIAGSFGEFAVELINEFGPTVADVPC